MMQTIFGQLFRHDGLTRAKLLDGYSNDYVPFDGNVYDIATGRNCIDTIARHAGKLHPKHIIRRDGNIVKNADDKLQYILSIRPNPLMTTSEFIEKIVAQYYCYNNLFVYIQRNQNGDITALWPLNFNNLELFEDRKGNLYCKFTFGSGEQEPGLTVIRCIPSSYIIPYFINTARIAIRTNDESPQCYK
jgi:hypothetical protein